MVAALLQFIVVSPAFASTLRVPADYGTAQAAINAVVLGQAPDDSVIELQPGVYPETLRIAGTSKSMTIRGVMGSAATIIDATSRNQTALQVLVATGNIRIEGLTFRGGVGGAGVGGGFTFQESSPTLTDVVIENSRSLDGAGGVIFKSSPTFSHCEIRNNTADRFAGGLLIITGSRPVFTDCRIYGNISGAGGPGLGNIGSGGGIHVNDASPTFRGCLITNNRSRFAGGGIMHLGIYDSPYGISTLMLEDTEVSNNVAERYSPAENPAEGGGAHIEDNAIAYLIRATIKGNTANSGGGLSSYRARYEATSSTIEGNHAQDSQAVGGFAGGIGLGSNNTAQPFRPAASLSLVDSAVRGNDSRVGGGILATGDQVCGGACNPATATRAAVQITDSLIADNIAGVQGGGIRFDRADVVMTGSHIINNSATTSGQSYGGGLLLATGTVATLDGVTVAKNASVDLGGGLFVEASTTLTLRNSRVYGNTSNSGGGLFVGSNGPPSGTVQNTVIADNSNYQIHEQACSPLQRTILAYVNNVITPRVGFSDLYFSTCGGATTTIATLNSSPSGRSSGNTSATPSFISFLATPDTGRSLLSWSVSRATTVTISGVGTFSGHTGDTLVTPAPTTTYWLTSAGGPSSAAAATVSWAAQWGLPTDTPTPGDFDGDGRDDWAIFRASTGTWYIAGSTGQYIQQPFGWPGDIPVAADYDGDGKTDIAVFRPMTGTWYARTSSGGVLVATWGQAKQWDLRPLGDTPVPGDYDGDGRADIAIYRASTGQWFVRRSSGGTAISTWGQPDRGDIPVQADYDGDGRTDVAVYRTTTGEWFVFQSSLGAMSVLWGAPSSLLLGDVPVPADYDGDGKADPAVVRGLRGDWYILKSSNGGRDVRRVGMGDARVPGDFNGDGRAEIAIWRAATGTWLVQP